MSSENRTAGMILLIGVAVLALAWVLVLGPKRNDRADVSTQVATAQQRLDAANQQVATFENSKKSFAQVRDRLRRLNVAVPAKGEVADLLRELQRRSGSRGTVLRIAALQTPGSSTTGSTPVTAGAIPGPAGLSALPFTFEFTGRYLDLLHLLASVRHDVHVSKGHVGLHGRLLTIDGLSFQRPDRSSPLTKATINATAYIAATPSPAATAPAASTTGGS